MTSEMALAYLRDARTRRGANPHLLFAFASCLRLRLACVCTYTASSVVLVQEPGHELREWCERHTDTAAAQPLSSDAVLCSVVSVHTLRALYRAVISFVEHHCALGEGTAAARSASPRSHQTHLSSSNTRTAVLTSSRSVRLDRAALPRYTTLHDKGTPLFLSRRGRELMTLGTHQFDEQVSLGAGRSLIQTLLA